MEVHGDSIVRRSPLLTYCTEPGCATLTMGGTCVAHDPADPPAHPQGTPFVKTAEPFIRTTQREVRGRVLPG